MTTRISESTRERITLAWPSILAALAAGELVRNVLKAHNISPNEMRAFRVDPAMQRDWDAAREDSADAFMDEAMDVARDPYETVTRSPTGAPLDQPLIIRRDPAHARTYIDTLKWAARIRNPRLYGDKAQLDVNVKTLDLTRIISEANARLANAPRARILEHDQSVSDRAIALIGQRTLADLM